MLFNSSTASLMATLFIFIWLGVLSFLLFKLISTLRRLTKGVTDKDLKTVLEEILFEIKKEKDIGENIKKTIAQLQSEGLEHIQKIGFVRYNPFSETGGNQSFVLAVLDGHNSGFVLTSLHSREATRIFSKPVKDGKEEGYEFSKEEIQAIMIATKRKKN